MAPDFRYLRLPEIRQLTGLAAATIWRKVKTGQFPAPVKLTARATAWKSDEVTEWLESRAAARVSH